MILRPHFSIVLRLSFVVLLTFKNSSENIFEGPCLERFWTSSDANVSMKMKFCKKKQKKKCYSKFTQTRSSKLSVVKENLATLSICSVHSTLQFYIHRLSTIGAQCLFTFWTCIDLPHLSLKVPQRYNALQCLLSVFHFHRHAFFPPSFPYFRFNTSK